MSDLVLCRSIREVTGGYVVELRWPYGGNPGGYGEVVCQSLDEVFRLIRKASPRDAELRSRPSEGSREP